MDANLALLEHVQVSVQYVHQDTVSRVSEGIHAIFFFIYGLKK
jgi:hypothetical protein